MANNLFANIPAAVVCKTASSFASAGLTSSNISIIYEVGNPLKSWVPGRSINPITAFEVGKGYYVVPKADLDLSALLIPPITSGGGGGGSYDADAAAYFAATARAADPLSDGDKTKWNSFVTGAKGAGVWADIIQVCYFNGTDKNAVGVNAKTPGTKDIAFAANPAETPPFFSIDSAGIIPLVSTARGDTGIFPATDLENNNVYVGFFSRDDNHGGEHYFFGSYETGVGALKIQNSDANLYISAGTNNSINGPSSKDGFIALNRTSANSLKVYRNSTEVLNDTATNSDNLPNSELLLFLLSIDRTPTAVSGNAEAGIYNAPGINKCGFWIVSKNMTPTKHTALNTLVQNLMA